MLCHLETFERFLEKKKKDCCKKIVSVTSYAFVLKKRKSLLILFLMASSGKHGFRIPVWLNHRNPPSPGSVPAPFSPSGSCLSCHYNPVHRGTLQPLSSDDSLLLCSCFLEGKSTFKAFVFHPADAGDICEASQPQALKSRSEVALAILFHSEAERIHSCSLPALSSPESVKWQFPRARSRC